MLYISNIVLYVNYTSSKKKLTTEEIEKFTITIGELNSPLSIVLIDRDRDQQYFFLSWNKFFLVIAYIIIHFGFNLLIYQLELLHVSKKNFIFLSYHCLILVVG